jgi:GR25 family glycosyltransferase involved in LPS biosynthesis
MNNTVAQESPIPAKDHSELNRHEMPRQNLMAHDDSQLSGGLVHHLEAHQTIPKKNVQQSILSFFAKMPAFFLQRDLVSMACLTQVVFNAMNPSRVSKRYLHYLLMNRHLCRMFHRKNETQNYPVYLINRNCDSERMRIFDQRAKKIGLSYIRVEAENCIEKSFDFTCHLNDIDDHFYGSKHFPRGTIGCYLSHLKVWRIFEANSNSPLALVCEDDAKPLGRFPTDHADFGIPGDADVVFFNHRLSEGFQTRMVLNELKDKRFIYKPLKEALHQKILHDAEISGTGCDGYILTRKGVKNLLKLVSERKMSSHTDWFLVFSSLNRCEAEEFKALEGSGRFSTITVIHGRLKSYVMLPSLVEQPPGVSTIAVHNPENLISREVMLNHKNEKTLGKKHKQPVSIVPTS